MIFSVDGFAVDDMQSLNYRIATHKPGDTVKMHVRRGGKTTDIAVKLDLPPENPPRELTTVAGRSPMTGAKVENLSPAVALELQMNDSAKGVVIVSTQSGTPSAGYGFQAGDIIRSVNGITINRVGDLTRALEGANGQWNMVVDRDGRQMRLSVSG